MERVVILGRGGAGKSTLARRLGHLTGLPVIELDKHFWQTGLVPLSPEAWTLLQRQLASEPRWIMDGDLGRYDVLSERLKAADTILILDFPLLPCLWRAIRRSREKLDFWWWLLTWRLIERPKINRIIHAHANRTKVIVFRGSREIEAFLSTEAALK